MDDDAAVRRSLGRALRLRGFAVTEADGGAAALDPNRPGSAGCSPPRSMSVSVSRATTARSPTARSLPPERRCLPRRRP
ncbi:hypothetical protein ABZ599_39285 [Streptomyces misionensis]|uniref:hypothetical protein n=1 Tax=Streptomyces misionensis TaxID=67331 RepID=UPI0033F277FE